MSRKIIIIAIILMVVFIWLVGKSGIQQRITAPGFSQTLGTSTPEPSATAPVAPTTYEYDASTDLEAELEKINPEVLDSDFQ